MTDHIEPALDAKAWADVTAGNGIPYAYGSSILDELSMLEGRDIPAAIAYLNHELPDADDRKITREMVGTIASAARAIEYDNGGGDENDVATWNSKLAIEVAAIAKALASYLPPD